MLKINTLGPRRLARLGWLGAALLATQVAAAGPIAFGSFLQFSFDAVGAPVKGCDPADPLGNFCIPSSGTVTGFLDAPSWTFNAPAGGASLTVVDAFVAGDEFQVFDFGVLVGATSLSSGRPVPDCGDDPVVCLATAGMSKGVFALAPGAHALTLVSTRLFDTLGSAYLRVDVANRVSEPASLALVLGALGTMLGANRRRSNRTGSAA